MSDENKNTAADDKAEEKVEVTKKTAAKKKEKAKSSEDSESEGNKNKVIEKLEAMGVMSGGKSKENEKNDSRKAEFLKVAAASAVAILVVGSFVWALDKEATKGSASSNFNNTSHSNPYAMQSNPSSQWGPSSMNQSDGRSPGFSATSHENNQKNYETQQERMKKHREQQQKWMQQRQKAFEQQQAQRQKWIDQQKQANTNYQLQQQKWMKQQQTQQQPYPQNSRQQQIPAHQQQWIEQQKKANADYQALQQKWFNQQRAQQHAYPQNPMQQKMPVQQQQWLDQQRAQQKLMQDQQLAQQQQWRQQNNNPYPPQINYQGQAMPPVYNNAMGYQQPAPYNYNGR